MGGGLGVCGACAGDTTMDGTGCKFCVPKPDQNPYTKELADFGIVHPDSATCMATSATCNDESMTLVSNGKGCQLDHIQDPVWFRPNISAHVETVFPNRFASYSLTPSHRFLSLFFSVLQFFFLFFCSSDNTFARVTFRLYYELYVYLCLPRYYDMHVVVMTQDDQNLGDNIDLYIRKSSAPDFDNWDFTSVRESNPWAIDIFSEEVA